MTIPQKCRESEYSVKGVDSKIKLQFFSQLPDSVASSPVLFDMKHVDKKHKKSQFHMISESEDTFLRGINFSTTAEWKKEIELDPSHENITGVLFEWAFAHEMAC